jgi:hypothetical protein
MPPPNLGDNDPDEDPEDSDDKSSSSSDSDMSTLFLHLRDDEGDKEPAVNKDAAEQGETDDALVIVDNGATSPNVFARLFTQTALTELFTREPLDMLRILVMERVRMFHRWLNERHKLGVSLSRTALDQFDDEVMTTLVEADSCGSVEHERSGTGSKDAGVTLPTFSGAQGQYKVWNSKWRAYLGNMKNADGSLLLYVIIHLKKEKKSVRHQLTGASLKESQFKIDNFKVSQLLEIALADGSTSIFTATHSGD